MSWGYVAIAGATLVSGYLGSEAQKDAASEQGQASEAGIAEQRRQFDAIQELLRPYVEAGSGAVGDLGVYETTGTDALAQQRALLGLEGVEAQEEAIAAVESSPQFTSLIQQGEEALLQNASATGGLRGGNLQGALAQFRPQILSQLLESQYGKLSGLSEAGRLTTGQIAGLGQASAAGQAAAGQQTASNISNLLASQGQASAASQLAQAQLQGQTVSNLAGLFAAYQNRPQNSGGSF